MSPIIDTRPPRIATTLGLKRSQSFPAKGAKEKVKDIHSDPIHAAEKKSVILIDRTGPHMLSVLSLKGHVLHSARTSCRV